jgi:hypothetical protein
VPVFGRGSATRARGSMLLVSSLGEVLCLNPHIGAVAGYNAANGTPARPSTYAKGSDRATRDLTSSRKRGMRVRDACIRVGALRRGDQTHDAGPERHHGHTAPASALR